MLKAEQRGWVKGRNAEEALLQQVFLRVEEEVFHAFQAHLGAPPQPSARLRKAMQTPPLHAV